MSEEQIGHDDREQAVTWLQEHHAAGRMSSTEYEDRAVRARQASTTGDLAQLFTDLPQPKPAVPSGLASPGSDLAAEGRRPGLVPEQYAHILMAASPILAVILFFVTDSWLWFLAIPLVGIVAYGPDGRPKRNRNRR